MDRLARRAERGPRLTLVDPRRTPLVALLEAFEPGEPDAKAFRDETLAFVRGAEHPYGRDRFAPGHVTASAFVADPEGAAVLLVAHRAIGRWIQPGGHVDPDDPDPQAAAAREAVEETGVLGLVPVGPPLLDVDVHRHPGKPGGDPPHIHFDLRFGFRAGSAVLAPTDEVADARWVALEDWSGLERSVGRAAGALLAALT
ncbi:MAG TPA: NUDIX domain-containing protein [Acidimicrobiia bacterium]|nr:NUDIX domain-containing protein [Acidimicrobiia bacterium]